MLTLEKQFPFILKYQRVVTLLDSNYLRLGGRVDTIRKDSRNFEPYRKGTLLNDAGGRQETVSAFTVSDIAGEEFRKHHCYWYPGRDIDWAGSILVDSASMRLLQTEARLFFYAPIVPSLPQEFQARSP